MRKGGAVYIMSAPDKTALYTGVTSNLAGRVWEHQNKVYPESFTSKYNCTVLVYYNYFDTIEQAIDEEKRIKGGSRKKKIALIESINKDWLDLSNKIEN
ncbi:MAG: GIY-YIG nuclease family protein [Bacteroidetes bacterium]|nr:GIY-YIG nuclease family protein [Bacteroidota bacterium]